MTTMNGESLLRSVEQSIRTVLDTKSQIITPETCLIGDLGAESIDFLDLSCEIEKLTGVELEFRKILQRKRQESQEQTVDISVQDIVENLKQLA
jgi:acyl carrier protein